jgi:hypothetical protein
MFRFAFSLPLFVSLSLLTACSSVDPVDTSLVVGSTNAPAEITAFCDDHTVVKSRTLDYGSTRHPFALSVPRGSTCRFTITRDPDTPRERYTALVLFELDHASSPRISTKSSSIDLGFMLLPADRLTFTEGNPSSFSRKPIRVRLNNEEGMLMDDEAISHDTKPASPPVI